MLQRVSPEVASFLVIGCGALGCVVGGLLADRVGRTVVTSWAMAISGTCCLLIGFLFGGNPFLLLFVAAIWGASVIADSAQFSACVTELGDPQYVGTALTMQTCIGFLLTTCFNRVGALLFVKLVGWRYAFAILAPGPFLGVMAMFRLRSLAGSGEDCARKKMNQPRIARIDVGSDQQSEMLSKSNSSVSDSRHPR